MNWYIKAIKQYIDFSGRARRKEYWMFILFNGLFCIPFILILDIIDVPFFNYLLVAYVLFMITPTLAVTTRRLHDINKSGWLILIKLIPFGGIVLFIFMCSAGTEGSNKYGADPKGQEDELDDIGTIET